MRLPEIWWNDKNVLLSMGAYVAWLWFFPLFGIVQASFQNLGQKVLVFNLVFFSSKILGFAFILFRLHTHRSEERLVRCAPLVTAVLTMLIAFAIGSVPLDMSMGWTTASLVLFVLMPAITGFFAAIYFAAWGTTLYYVSGEIRGRFMASMVLSATALYTVLILVYRVFPLAGIVLSGLFLLIPAVLISSLLTFPRDHSQDAGLKREWLIVPEAESFRSHPLKHFWLPFSLVVLCFYIVSFPAHELIFAVIRTDGVLSPVVGQVIYAVTILCAALYVDRKSRVDVTAIFGLVALGCSFLLLPLALDAGVLWPLYFLLESSYGLIDLFVWVSLAYFCHVNQGDPRWYFATGLLLNVIFLFAGIVLSLLMNVDFASAPYQELSLAAGILLFLGVLPALSLRNLQLTGQKRMAVTDILEEEIEKIEVHPDVAMDRFTRKEKEVVYLMIAGHSNELIAETMGISRNTIKTHIRNIYRKAEVSNRSELLFVLAKQYGIGTSQD